MHVIKYIFHWAEVTTQISGVIVQYRPILCDRDEV